MTTITIERAVLLRALEALRPATAPNGAKRDAAFEELRAALAAPATAPAWHDAPTVPGLWVVGSRCLHINELDLPIYERSNCRWYGPVPEDKP